MPDSLAALASLEGVASAMTATRDGIDALLRDRGPRRTTPEQTGQSLLEGARASGLLEGDADADGPSTLAAIRVSTELLGLAPTLLNAPSQAIARIHVLAAHGHPEAGRPHDDRGAGRLLAVGRMLTAPTTAPALVVAAVVHAELATAEPFAVGNGVVARAVERLVLVARGVDPRSLTVPEAGHLALAVAYASNLRGYRDGGKAGVQGWLLYAAQAFAAGAEASPLRE